MTYDLVAQIYHRLRESADLTQPELAEAAGLRLRSVQRIEHGEKLPSRAEESALMAATACSRPSFVQAVCKVLSFWDCGRVVIVPDGGSFLPVTPVAAADELLHAARKGLPEDRWWAWVDRLGRLKIHGLQLEQETLAALRDLKAELRTLE